MLSLFHKKSNNIFNILAKKPDSFLNTKHTLFFRHKHKTAFCPEGQVHVYRPITGQFCNGHNLYAVELKDNATQIPIYGTSDRNVTHKVDGISYW